MVAPTMSRHDEESAGSIILRTGFVALTGAIGFVAVFQGHQVAVLGMDPIPPLGMILPALLGGLAGLGYVRLMQLRRAVSGGE